MPGDLITREITAGDAAAVASLSAELGYPVSTEAMRQRIEALAGLAGHGVYIACLSGAVVGWIHICAIQHLQSGSYAEIGGLVVASEARDSGIGRRLVECAEQWAMRQGLETVLVRSQIAREAAHRFYLREGYTRTKTSAVFTKKLA